MFNRRGHCQDKPKPTYPAGKMFPCTRRWYDGTRRVSGGRLSSIISPEAKRQHNRLSRRWLKWDLRRQMESDK